MRRLRKFMIGLNTIILLATLVADLADKSLALWLFSCEWGIGIPDRTFVFYYLLFYGVPALNIIALLTNKERPAKPTAGVKLFPDNPL